MSEKASGLRQPSKIGRPCCTGPPKPAVPSPSPRSSMNSMEPIYENPIRRNDGLRRGSDASVVLTEDTDSFIIGDRVWVGGSKPGSIAYIGETQFAPGEWAGVVLDDPIGKNDGSVAGARYFQCAPKHGIFSRLTRLTRFPLADAVSPRIKSPASPDSRLNKSISPSLNASMTSLSSVSQRDLKIGDRVIVSSSQGSKTGVLRYIGETEFAAGEWCGVELDDPVGKNDGSIADKRYFECRPKHGLFAPLHKVSRSPSSKRPSICVVHKPSGAALNSSLRKTSSRESLTSLSSLASTTASTATRGATRKTGLRTATPARSSLQEMLKEKQQEIEMLRKERDLERERITKAATQADHAEQKILKLQKEYDKYREDMEKTVLEAQSALEKLLEEKSQLFARLEEEKQKSEDLLFRFEEESVNKEDIQTENAEVAVINTYNETKINELESQLTKEREQVIQLEKEHTRLLEVEKELTKLRHENTEFLELQNRNWCLEEAKITLEKQIFERNDLIKVQEEKINELQVKLSRDEEEIVKTKDQEVSNQKIYEEFQKSLAEKTKLLDEVSKEKELNEDLKQGIETLKERIEKIIEDSKRERNALEEKYEKVIEDKDNLIKIKSKELEEETVRHAEEQKSVLAHLKADNEAQVSKLAQDLNEQLVSKDQQIEELKFKYQENLLQLEKVSQDLKNQELVGQEKDSELKKALEQLDELKKKLKAAEEMNQELKKQIESLQINSGNEAKVIIEEKNKLEETLVNLQATSTAYSAQLEKLNENLKIKQAELIELQKSKDAEIKQLMESFESKLEEKTRFITEINADMALKSSRISNLEHEIAELKRLLASKDEEINSLLEKTSELKDAITLSEQTKTNLESELRMYEVNIAELNQKLAHSEEKISQLVDQKGKLEAEISSVISTSADSSEQLIKYNEDLRLKEKELDQLRERVFELENSSTSSEAKLNRAEEELKAVNQVIEQLKTEAGELRDQLDGQIKTREELNKEIGVLKAKEVELSGAKEVLAEEIRTKQLTIEDLGKQLKGTEENLSSLSEKFSSLSYSSEEKSREFKNYSEELEQQIRNLQEESKSLKENGDKLLEEKVAIEKTLGGLRHKLEEEIESKVCLETLSEERDNLIKSLEVRIEELNKEKEETSLVVQNLNVKYNESLVQLEMATSKDAEASLEVTSMREKIEQLKVSNEELQKSLEVMNQSATELKGELSKTQELEGKIKELESRAAEYDKLRTELVEEKDTVAKFEDEKKRYLKDLEESARDKGSLEEKVRMVESERESLKKEFEVRKREVESLQGEKQVLGEKLKLELEEVSLVKKRNQELESFVESMKSEVSNQNSTIAELQKQIEEMKKDKDELVSGEKTKDSELKVKQSEIDAVKAENESLLNSKVSLEKTLKDREGQIQTLTNLVASNESEIAKRTQNMAEELSKVRRDSEVLRENHNALDKENKMLSAKLSHTLKELKTVMENKKNSLETNSVDIKQNNGNKNGDLTQLIEENETFKGQIDFLNSVIVDMQQKNEKLQCKVQVLEMGVPANEADDYSKYSLDKKVTPRMFCDICDQFDLHETEDCPKQAQDFEVEKPVKKSKKPSVERPYCENCEMFGHDTAACDDAETF